MHYDRSLETFVLLNLKPVIPRCCFARLLISELKFWMVLRCMLETQKQILTNLLLTFSLQKMTGESSAFVLGDRSIVQIHKLNLTKGTCGDGITAVTSHLFVDITKQNCVINVV